MLPEVTLQMLSKSSDALVVRFPFGSEASKRPVLYVPIASSLTLRTIGWIRLERRTVLNGAALFEASELHPACGEAPDLELVLTASTQVRLGAP